MDPSIMKAEVWNAQGSFFALCRHGAKEQTQNNIFTLPCPTDQKPSSEMEIWRYIDHYSKSYKLSTVNDLSLLYGNKSKSICCIEVI